MEEDKIIDQSALANSISDSIHFEFTDMFLVKPLDPIKVTKEFSKPVSKGTTTDKDGVEAQDFDEVETEVKEVDSDYRKGVVIKIPLNYEKQLGDPDNAKYIAFDIKVGDIVVFRDRSGQPFDLLKDSKMLRLYDIVAIEK